MYDSEDEADEELVIDPELVEVNDPIFRSRYIFSATDAYTHGVYGAIFKVYDTYLNTSIIIKFIPNNHYESTFVEEEVRNTAMLQSFRRYTDCIPFMIDDGEISPYLLSDLNIDIEVEEIDGAPTSFRYIAMPIYDGPNMFKLMYTTGENFYTHKSLLFEIIYTLIILNKNGINHGDLHLGNIIFSEVAHSRRYTINGIKYRIDTKILPIIIDWSSPRAYPYSKYGSKNLQKFVAEIEDYTPEDMVEISGNMLQIPPEIKSYLIRNNYQVVFDPFFDSLLTTEIGPNTKSYQPILI